MKTFFSLSVLTILVCLLAFTSSSLNAQNIQPLPGPIPATITKIIGPGKFLVAARTWLGALQQSYVEIRDLQIPQKDGACPLEREVAANALAFVRQQLVNKEIFLTQVSYSDKPATVKANIIDASRDDLGKALLRNNLAKPVSASIGFCR